LGVSLQTLGRVTSQANRENKYRHSIFLKSNGKIREINAVQGNLKLLQRRLLAELQSRYIATPYAHGFVPGKSILTNAEVHKKKRLIVKVDIKDFFPSITFPRVVGMFKVFPFEFEHEAAVTLASIVCLPDQVGQLPQGGVTSPYVANMIARRMDVKLAKLAKQQRCGYTRYADDITFSTNDVKSVVVPALIESIYNVIREEHFIPNEEKTKVLTPRQRQVVAGIVVNSGLSVNRKYLRNIRATLYNCENDQDIVSQITKFEFKDPRSSRTNLRQTVDGSFELNGMLLNEEDAVAYFFKHIAGQLAFVLQTVNGNKPQYSKTDEGIIGLHIKRLGEGAINSLYIRFYELLKQHAIKYKKLRAIKKSIAHLINRNEVLKKSQNLIELEDQRNNAKKLSLAKFHETGVYKREKAELESTQNLGELKKFCELRFTDPRYELAVRSLSNDFDVAKSAITKLTEYPKVSLEHTRGLFKSIQEGELSEFFHQPKNALTPPTATLIISSFLKEFYPIYYYLPNALRLIIEDYIDAIAREGAQVGMDESISLIDSPNLAETTAQLQTQIRFADPEMEDGRCTSLQDMIEEIARKVEKSVKQSRKKKIKFHINDIDDTKFYTHVKSIRIGLASILKSVAEHAQKGEVIEISMKLVGKEAAIRRSISIESHQTKNLPGSPSKRFYLSGGGGGDMSNAVKTLNGIAQYYVEGSFSDGRYVVGMISGSSTPAADGEKLIHKIEL
jgi:retron-type reverse transcriptase